MAQYIYDVYDLITNYSQSTVSTNTYISEFGSSQMGYSDYGRNDNGDYIVFGVPESAAFGGKYRVGNSLDDIRSNLLLTGNLLFEGGRMGTELRGNIYGTTVSHRRGDLLRTITHEGSIVGYPTDGAVVDESIWVVLREIIATVDMKLNINGALKEYDKGWVNVDGQLKEIDKMWTRVDNTLREV